MRARANGRRARFAPGELSSMLTSGLARKRE
jgi:hypothetical protein